MVLLGALVLIGNYVDPPIKQARLLGSLARQVTTWGGVTALGDRAVHLYNHPLGFPFLRREVLRITEEEPDADGPLSPEPEHASCHSAFVDYLLRHPGRAAGPR